MKQRQLPRPQNEQPLLIANGLMKRYGSVTACGHVSLTVDEGEVLAIVGDVRSGKSTLLNMLAAGCPRCRTGPLPHARWGQPCA